MTRAEPVVTELKDADGISALVERLRTSISPDGAPIRLVDAEQARKTMHEAADALTRLEAEIREVRDRERRWKSSAEYVGQEIVKAQATIARLEAEKQQYAALYMDRCKKWSRLKEALESIVGHVGNQEAAVIRAALASSSSDA
jgi:chromosome segregation ATPase